MKIPVFNHKFTSYQSSRVLKWKNVSVNSARLASLSHTRTDLLLLLQPHAPSETCACPAVSVHAFVSSVQPYPSSINLPCPDAHRLEGHLEGFLDHGRRSPASCPLNMLCSRVAIWTKTRRSRDCISGQNRLDSPPDNVR
ncbi:unnamed protein product [Protopolystoma xenopodis]|uniref:Uncharacterized protein n=1 Tax=Protopolystoma xenopodis TaxID=117903 RepID=A0A448WKQ4_9PLAT|nr:unnamed protein product [Protopolystoma xenopodis]